VKYVLLALSILFSACPAALADDCQPIREAIQALPEAGGEVLIAPGLYNCAAPIVINRSRVALRGAGRDKVTLRLADWVHAPLLIIGEPRTIVDENGNFVAAHRVDHIEVTNLTLDGNRLNHDHRKECGEGSCDGDTMSVRNNGITIRGASEILVENVTAHSTISGGMVTEKHCRNLVVRNFESYDNYFDGFAGYETVNSEFTNLNLHHNRSAGISIDIQFNNNIFRDSRLIDNGDVGIFARELHGNLFQRLSIQNSGNHGVFLAISHGEHTCANDNEFNEVSINGSKRAGFRLNNACPGNRITGASNLCGNSEGGISVEREDRGLLHVDESVACK
jgi:hypothetical protein